MSNFKKRALSLIISLIMCLLTLSAAAPAKNTEAAGKYIKVEAFIKYAVQQLKLQVDKSSKTPYIDAALKAGILKQSDFKSYTGYLTRTDAAVIANRIDEYLFGEYFGYPKEVYELLKDGTYVNGKLYYNTKGSLYPQGENDLTYQPSQFLEDVVVPRWNQYISYNKKLSVCYYTETDDSGNITDQYMVIGLESDKTANVDPLENDDYLIQAWQAIVDGERLFKAVYDKRISDLNKVAKSKRQGVAEAVAKGIIKGYSNGMYIQNRSLKGSSKITASGAKGVVALAINKDKRAKLSPDGQLIRTTKLPSNASEYPYILECFPNEFYEMVYEIQRDKQYQEGTLDRDKYHYPNETGNAYILKEYADFLAPGMEPYGYYDTLLEKAEQYVINVFNVDYRKVDQKWINAVEGTYAPVSNSLIHEQILKYIEAIKINHVTVESKVISLEHSTLYEYEGDFYVRVYVKYRVTADNVKVDFDNKLIFGNITSTYLVGLKSGEWTYGYYDINLFGTNMKNRTYMDFGIASWAGISDEALKGSK